MHQNCVRTFQYKERAEKILIFFTFLIMKHFGGYFETSCHHYSSCVKSEGNFERERVV